ncbi:hypothetical protein DFQ28_009855, partial [Apophysomyces sp. BC1034]
MNGSAHCLESNIVHLIHGICNADIQKDAERLKLEFVYVNCSSATTKDKILDIIARSLNFPAYFGKNWDALYDCLTDFTCRD